MFANVQVSGSQTLTNLTMNATERKAALKAAGVTQADIARRVKKGRPYVNEVVHGTRRSPEIRRAIARAIGRPVAEVFADDQPAAA